jgi:Uncharacterized protein with SCP/PR1 domains
MKSISCLILVIVLLQALPAFCRPLSLEWSNSDKGKKLKAYIISIRRLIQSTWCEDPPSKAVKATVSFTIERSGNISEVHLLRFDGEMKEAVTTVRAVVQSAPYAVPPLGNRNHVDVTASFDSKDLKATAADKNVIDNGQNVEQEQPTFFDLLEAREYGLDLINKDRSREGLKPVALDKIASQAGQLHSDEMARDLYTSHWNVKGQTPPQRYSLSGGFDYSAENARGSTSWPDWSSAISASQQFSRREIEHIQACLMRSAAHKSNILDPERTHVGLGYTLAIATHPKSGMRIRQIYCAQEFLNRFGSYQESSPQLKRLVPYVLKGTIEKPYRIHLGQIRRGGKQMPIPIQELRTDKKYVGSYSFPSEQVVSTSIGKPQSKDATLESSGSSFQLTVVPGENWSTGLYYLILFAIDQNNKEIPVCVRVLSCQ